ncbi:MAG: hypothetical protein ACE5MB_04690, partial [Anaerolineae bacterium]
MEPQPRIRFPLMALGLLGLLAAMWAGLVRLGWGLPPLQAGLTIAHGPLMISGFLGTLISLERAVALDRRWTYAAPLFTGLGALALLMGMAGPLGPLLMTLGSLGLVAVFVVIVRRRLAPFTVTMGLGALAWFIGNTLWLTGRPVYSVVPWWAGFLVLTIVGERLDLSRLLHLSHTAQWAFLAATGLFLLGTVASIVAPDIGLRLAGVGMVALTLWLLRYDIARRTVRQAGLTRFIAVCLLSGYVWLGVSGGLALVFGSAVAGPRYDAMLHALFLGFVFAMIFGHAPIIFPAVLGFPMVFRPTFYAHLALLHLSLLLRVAGDLTGWWPGRQWGGLLNVMALLLFLANTGRAARGPQVL